MEIVQSQINYDWARKKLGEIASVKYGFTGKAATEGKYRYVRITDINKTGLLTSNEKKYIKDLIEVEDYLLKDNDLLMARTGATFANVLLYKDYEPSIFASYLIRISFDIEMENKLYWYFSKSKNYWDQANKLSSGAAQPHFNGKALKNIIFTYPKSTLEQKLIVAILDQAFAAIDQGQANIQQNIQNAQDLFQSKLNQIFSQQGEGWEEKTFKEICSIITDGTHQTPKYFDSGYIFLSSKNVTSGKIDWENVKYLDEEQHTKMYSRLSPQINDILLAKNGTTGVAAIVDVDKVFDIYVSLALLRPTEVIYPYYLLHFINSSAAKKQFNKRLKGIGVPNLHLKEIREVIINFPTSIEKQQEISAYIDKLIVQRDLVLAKYEQKQSNLEELKKSLLQKAFSGELTQNKKAA